MDMNDFKVQTVSNGFIVKLQLPDLVGDPSRNKWTYPDETFVFANAASLAVWVEAWAKDKAAKARQKTKGA